MDSDVSDFWLRVDSELSYRGIDRKVFAKDIGIMPNTISSGIIVAVGSFPSLVGTGC